MTSRVAPASHAVDAVSSGAGTAIGAATAGAPTSGSTSGTSVSRRAVQLYAGQIHASREATAVTTILGSCVSVCLWDAATSAGGINHFLLPERVNDGSATRFASAACEQLIARMARLGSEPRSLQAKVFGGASVIAALRSGVQRLGERNVEVAMSILEREHIPVVASDVLGKLGRKLVFHTDTGVAWVKAIERGP